MSRRVHREVRTPADFEHCAVQTRALAAPAVASDVALIAVVSLSAGARTSSTKALATDLLPSSHAKGIASLTRRRDQ
jgi:hypothetical protein